MTYVVRMTGGPLAGQQMFAMDGAGWPPPDALELEIEGAEPGRYVLGPHSQLTDEEIAALGEVRGAEYVWEPEVADARG